MKPEQTCADDSEDELDEKIDYIKKMDSILGESSVK